MVHILTSSGNILSVEVRPQEPRVGDSATTVNLTLPLKQQLSNEVFREQQGYLNTAAIAAYVSLNKIDQRNRFKASVNLKSQSTDGLNFIKGSTSSGLGFTLALFNAFWTKQLNKGQGFTSPIFATGEVLNNGDIKAIGHLEEKLQSTVQFAQDSNIANFTICIPQGNAEELSPKLINQIQQNGGQIIAATNVQELLGLLLGAEYDGNPLGRWEPFKGLNSFEYEDSVRFYGRKKDVERQYEDLDRNQGVLIVSGPTGSGKSSLIKAGLIPLLAEQKPNFVWDSITPKNISQSLLATILDLIYANKETEDELTKNLETAIRNDQVSAFTQISEELENSQQTVLLHIDQFEDFFTQDINPIYLNDIEVLHNLTKQVSQIKIVLSTRNEYINSLLGSGVLKSPVISNVSENLPVEAWREIVIEQAAFSGLSFEDGLAEKIINDSVNTPNALPMVEFVLTQLFERAKDENSTTLKNKHYVDLGGLSGAISGRAQQVLEQRKSSVKLVSKLFDHLVGLNAEKIPYARYFNIKDVQDDVELTDVLSLLNEANLVTYYGERLKLAHDSLFNNWSTLQHWIKEREEYLLWRDTIESQWLRWQENKQKEWLLKDSNLLEKAKNYLKTNQVTEQNLAHFIDISLKTKRNRVLKFLASFVVLPVLIAIILIWDKNTTRSEYYANFGEKWGVPFGVGNLSSKQISKKDVHYNFTYEGGWISKILGYGSTLLEIQHVNSFGHLLPDYDNENVAKWEYTYKENGQLDTVTFMNETSTVLKKYSYQFSDLVAYVDISNNDYKSTRLTEELKGIDLVIKRSNQITRLEKNFSPNGFIHEEFFIKDGYGKRVPNEYGFFGKKYSYNSYGLKSSVDYLDKDGKSLSVHEISKIAYSYNYYGLKTKEEFLDVYENLVLNNQGYAQEDLEYNDDLNVINTKVYDQNGKPTLSKNGVFATSTLYDSKGQPSEVKHLNPLLQPTINSNFYSVERFSYDKSGNLVKREYFDSNHKPIVIKEGFSSVAFVFNQQGRITQTDYFGADGKPILRRDGYAREVTKYDEDGNITQQSYFGIDGNPILIEAGYSSQNSEFDNNGYSVKTTFFGINGQPILDKNGIASFTSKYDERGNLVQRMFYDNQYKRTEARIGVSAWFSKFDGRNDLVEMRFIGTDNQPALHKEKGCASIILDYDDRKNRFIRSCLGVDGLLTLNKDGFALQIETLNDYGHLMQTEFFDNTRKPTLNKEGYSIRKTEVDKIGNLIRISYFDTNEQPINSIEGYSIRKSEYDDRGNEIKRSYLGLKGSPVLLSTGYAGWKTEFDHKGNKTQVTYLDMNGKPIIIKDGYAGWKSSFNDFGREVQRTYLGIDGKIKDTNQYYAYWKKEFDQRGNEIKVSYFASYGAPALANYDESLGDALLCSSVETAYDELGNETKRTCFDQYGNLEYMLGGYAIFESKYDSRSNLIERTYFNKQEYPTRHNDGYSKVIYKYNSRGQVLKTAYFDKNGKPAINKKEGYATKVNTFDARGNQIKTVYLDVHGTPVLNKYGSAGGLLTYDNKDRVIKVVFIDTDGNSIDGKLFLHDDLGNTIKQTYIGKDEHPVLLKDGYSALERKYDRFGNVTKTTFLSLDGMPTVINEGYSTIEREFDRFGNKIKVTFLGLDGKPILHKEGGVAGWYTIYDQSDEYQKTEYFGLAEEVITKGDKFNGFAWLDRDY